MKTDSILTVDDFGNDELFQTSANGSSSTSGKSREKTHISHTKENGNLCLFCRDEAYWGYPDEGEGYGDYGDSYGGYGDPYGSHGDNYGDSYGDTYGDPYGNPYDDEYGDSYGYDNYDDIYGEYDDGSNDGNDDGDNYGYDDGDGDKKEGGDDCDCGNHDDDLQFCIDDNNPNRHKPCDKCGSPVCERALTGKGICTNGDYKSGHSYQYTDKEKLIKDLDYWCREVSADEHFITENKFYTEVSIYFFDDDTFEVVKPENAETGRTYSELTYYDTNEGRKGPYYNGKLVVGYAHTHKDDPTHSSGGIGTDAASKIEGIDNYVFYRGRFHKY